jgi:voltage-gated potassium channel
MAKPQHFEPARSDLRSKMFIVIFGTSTKAGKRFDIVLLWAIVLSVLAVMLESVPSIQAKYHTPLLAIEWAFTILFTIEYIARIISVKKPLKYIFSFLGLIDLLSILPTFISFFAAGTHSLMVIRVLRLMRIFRVLKLVSFLQQAQLLRDALIASRNKIIVFLIAVLMTVVILGTCMYIIEDPSSGFTSIPRSIYWAIVTMTTVGYGDIAPQTPVGQALASLIMIIGYGIIAVPTGIVSSEMVLNSGPQKGSTHRPCHTCSREGHDPDSSFCKFCGSPL